MSDKVKCGECGLLVMRKWQSTEVAEVIGEWRRNGEYTPPGAGVRPLPVMCSVGEDCFPMKGFADNAKAVCESLNKEIECPSWRKWVPGKTPKEHEEMSMIERMQAEQAAFQQKELQHRKITIWCTVIATIAAIIALFK